MQTITRVVQPKEEVQLILVACTHLQNHGGRSDKPTFISTSGFIFESLLGFGVVFVEALT